MAEAGEGTTTETPGAPPKKTEEPKFGPVSYERFSEVNGAKRALSKEVEALRPKAAEADTLRARVAELEGQQAGWQEERAILGAGVLDDPDEAIDLARTFHRRLPEADRPTLADWIRGLAADGFRHRGIDHVEGVLRCIPRGKCGRVLGELLLVACDHRIEICRKLP